MGSYLDSSDAQLIALTRLRRSQRPPTDTCLRIVASAKTAEFHARCDSSGSSSTRRRSAMQSWRKRQWKAGVRSCFYCRGQTTRIPKHGSPGPSSVTVDHRVALANGGADHELNWVMCCSRCNNRKGSLSEDEFRSVLSLSASAAADRARPPG